MAQWITAARADLGDRLLVLGHHYQRDEVMAFADARGASFGLSRLAAASTASYVVFCGVHFMAESADILTGDHRQVVVPDLNAGCSMADMADLDSVEEAWYDLAAVIDVLENLVEIGVVNQITADPVTAASPRVALERMLEITRVEAEADGRRLPSTPDRSGTTLKWGQ